MINKYFAVALLVAIISFGACSKKKESSACNIEQFTVNGEDWQVGDNTVSKVYPKGTVVNNLSPTIKVSEGAKVSPASGAPQDFSVDVIYTVTAENGKTKTYTAKATVASGN